MTASPEVGPFRGRLIIFVVIGCRMEFSAEGCSLLRLEPLINHWVLDYFFHLYVDAFKNCRKEDFAEIRDIVSILIQRPFKCAKENSKLLRIMRLFACVEEGDDLDSTFDEDNRTPLESAVEVMDTMKESFPADLIDTNQQMLKEAAVVICIQKQQFGKAKKILKKFLPSSNNTQLWGDLLRIIQEKNVKHPLIANFSLSTMKEKIYDMCESKMQRIPSFLLTLAQKDSAELNEKSEEAPNPEPQREPSPRITSPKDKTPTADGLTAASQSNEGTSREKEAGSDVDCGPSCSLSAIRSQFLLLCQDDNPDVTFRLLCETDFCREDACLHRVSAERQTSKSPRACSPREEAAIIQEMAQRTCSVSLQQLVMEQDSQQENQSEEQEDKVETVSKEEPKRSNEPVRTLIGSPVPRKKTKILTDNPASDRPNPGEELDTWSDEEELFHRSRSSDSRVGTAKKKKWSVEESEWIRSGVKKFGEGKWVQILKKYPFKDRTPCMIKDRWRTMKKLSLL
ncbi:telomeric repeat-binding factor 2 isoform X2 [Dendrobates tinctorius]|uniref:telomeric repeat-binding factor 2 isoform X2 n=1 Tax=Dendrobates tinctorius TaxID=92724 RepID=UPI003CCA467B